MRLPQVARMPRTGMLSLTVSGTPSKTPRAWPSRQRAVLVSAAARAPAMSKVTIALSFGLTASIRVSTDSSASRGENARLA